MLHFTKSTPNSIETNKITRMKTCTQLFFWFVLKLDSYSLNKKILILILKRKLKISAN